MSHTLTKMDLAAMRQADTIVGYHDDSKGAIRCTKRAVKNEKHPFALDVYYDVEVESRIDTFSWHDPKHNYDTTAAHACASIDKGPRYNGLVEALRVGDEVSLRWAADGNGYTREHGLHMDKLYLCVRREGGKRPAQYLEYLVVDRIAPDNSARMICDVRKTVVDIA